MHTKAAQWSSSLLARGGTALDKLHVKITIQTLKKLMSFKVYLVNSCLERSVPMFINAPFPLTRNSGSSAQGGG